MTGKTVDTSFRAVTKKTGQGNVCHAVAYVKNLPDPFHSGRRCVILFRGVRIIMSKGQNIDTCDEKTSEVLGCDTAYASQRWKRLLAELIGTFILVIGSSGVTVVANALGHPVDRLAVCFASGLTVTALIYAFADVSGSHFNPAITIAFALRHDFPWRRVPGYLFAQIAGAVLASLSLCLLFGAQTGLGAVAPEAGVTPLMALATETFLSTFLVLIVLGTASGARVVGHNAALAVGFFIIAAGLLGGPVCDAAMNPARSLGPDIVLQHFGTTWIYLVGPLVGACIAVLVAKVLRGRGNKAERAAALGGEPGEYDMKESAKPLEKGDR
jgi:aquaporin Z